MMTSPFLITSPSLTLTSLITPMVGKEILYSLNGKVNACLTLRSEAAPAGGLSANSAVEEQNTAAQASKRQTTRFMGFPLDMVNTKLSVYHTGTASLALMLLRSRFI